MALNPTFGYSPGAAVAWAARRLRDGLRFDFADGTFKPAPATRFRTLPEDPDDLGLYRERYEPTPAAEWTDGDYIITFYDVAAGYALLPPPAAAVMRDGDDATTFAADVVPPPIPPAPAPPPEPIFIGSVEPGSGKVLSQAIGSYRRRKVHLRTPDGLAATGFTAADGLSCVLWAGDDQAPLATPAAEWDDPAQGTVWVTTAEADTASFAPGIYQGILWVLSQGRRIAGDRFALRLTAAPGTATALKVACTLGDMQALASGWVDQLQDLDDDQAGFAEERAAARAWRDDLIQRHYRGTGQPYGAFRLSGTGWGRRTGRRDEWLQGQLDADHLVLDTPGGKRLVRACAAYALAEVLRPQIGEIGKSSYQDLAVVFAAMAEDTAAQCTVEIDVNNDGFGDIAIELGTVDVLRA